MAIPRSARLYAYAAAVLLVAAPARAQYQPRPLNDPATGEKYHIEAAASFRTPSADIVVSSSQFNLVGSDIDLKRDLGLTDQHFPQFQVTLRPAVAHKFPLQYLPVSFTQ